MKYKVGDTYPQRYSLTGRLHMVPVLVRFEHMERVYLVIEGFNETPKLIRLPEGSK